MEQTKSLQEMIDESQGSIEFYNKVLRQKDSKEWESLAIQGKIDLCRNNIWWFQYAQALERRLAALEDK